jgi:hypothetical protein
LTDVPKYDLGLGASYRNDLFDVQGLLMATKDGEYETATVKYLYVERQQTLGANTAAGVRVGRVRHWLGFHNLKRENPHDADYIWHPPAIYREHAAHLATSGDGAQVYLRTEIRDWDLAINATRVRPVIEPMTESVAILFGDPAVGNFTSKSRITGVNLAVASPSRTLELRYDYTRMEMDLQSAIPFVKSGIAETELHTFGARYYFTDSLDVTAERIKVRNRGEVWKSFHAAWPVTGAPGGYALTLRWRPADAWQIAATADWWCTDETDCDGERGKAVGIPSHAYYSRSKIIALRYRFDEHWTTTLQVMHVDGSNTEIASSERRQSTDRVGLRVSYSW